jgi:hypothetical protein
MKKQSTRQLNDFERSYIESNRDPRITLDE